MLWTLMVILLIGIAFMLYLLIGGVFYSRKGWNKKFFHDVMGWHEPTKNITYNGVSFCSRCKYCHKRIHQDSQGNWF